MIALPGFLTAPTVGLVALILAIRAERRRIQRARRRVTLDQLRGWVDALLSRYAPGGRLVAASNDGPGFLQLAITGREAGWRQVELGLPDADWARESFALAVAVLDETGADSFVEHDPGNPDVPRFLRISLAGECSDVAERATGLLRRAAGVLSFPLGGTYTVSAEGSHHPEFYRSIADEMERSRFPRWIARRLSASMRRQAEELEHA